MAEADRWPASRTEFKEWFWTILNNADGSINGDALIHELNDSVHNKSGHFIRKENQGAIIYVIALHIPGIDDQQKKLCKVGITHSDLTIPTNHIEKERRTIRKRFLRNGYVAAEHGDNAKPKPIAEVLFQFRIGATDTTLHFAKKHEVEGNMGIPIDKAAAQSMRLYRPTNWVLTTRQFISGINTRLKNERYETTDVFENMGQPNVKVGTYYHQVRAYENDEAYLDAGQTQVPDQPHFNQPPTPPPTPDNR